MQWDEETPGRKQPRGLGNDLGSILGLSYGLEEEKTTPESSIRLALIEPNRAQPRTDFDEASLESLAENIRRNGVITPIALRKIGGPGEERYSIIAGERRFRAARMAGLSEIPAVVLDADEENAAVMALSENLQREDLNPVEVAKGIRALIESFSLTQEECAGRIGRSRSAVANSLRLLTLEEDILRLVAEGTLSEGHGRALLACPAEQRRKLAERAITGEWSVRRLEEEVKQLKKPARPAPATTEFDYAKDLSERLTASYGRSVRVLPGKRKGHLELEYYGNEDLDVLLAKLEKVFAEE